MTAEDLKSHQASAKNSAGGGSGTNREVEALFSAITAEQMAEFREAFDLFDLDGGGTISAGELATVLNALGQSPTQQEILDMVTAVDSDNSGELDFQEFVMLMARRLNDLDGKSESELLADAFKEFDLDGSGLISPDEMRLVLNQLGETLSEEEVDDFIQNVDMNGDGQIDFEEFQMMLVNDMSQHVSSAKDGLDLTHGFSVYNDQE